MNKKIIIPILILMLTAMSCTINLPNSDTKKSVDTEEVTVDETEEMTEEFETEEPVIIVTEPPVVATVQATEPPVQPTVAPVSGFFNEEFDGDTSNWSDFVVAGNPDGWYVTPERGRLAFELPRLTETYAYSKYTAAEYDDVYVEAKFDTITNTSNGIAVLCRISAAGWYELRVFTSGNDAGRFALYRYDSDLKAKNKNPYVNLLGGYPNLASMDIQNGIRSNTLGLRCMGNEISVFINGKQQNGSDKKPLEISDSYVKNGNAGVGVMSFSGEKVRVEVDWVETSQP